jgi:parallel beta-helix repeat protein
MRLIGLAVVLALGLTLAPLAAEGLDTIVTISATDNTATEAGRTTGRFTLTRTGSTALPLTVRYTVGGTAIEGKDYVTLPGRRTIPAGSATATIVVRPIDDRRVERDETVILQLAPGAYRIGVPNRATVRLVSDDRVIYVANNGVDTATCGDSHSPCRSISRAISNADPGMRIMVGPGSYGDLNRDGVFGGPGEEAGEIDFGCHCLVKVTKQVTILSTHGATVTVVDATLPRPGGSLLVAVRIFANGVVFGRPGHGFTLTRSGRTSALAVGGVTGVVVAGNIASHNSDGFVVAGTGNILEHNIAIANDGSGFALLGTGHTVHGNVATASGDGFIVHGSGHVLSENVSSGNEAGFSLFGSAELDHNSAVGNFDVGVRIEQGGAAVVARTNIFGNGDRGRNIAPRTNCGLLNRSGLSITATDNFWGVATGPGPNPADDICDVGNSTSIFVPFASKEFKLGATPVE